MNDLYTWKMLASDSKRALQAYKDHKAAAVTQRMQKVYNTKTLPSMFLITGLLVASGVMV